MKYLFKANQQFTSVVRQLMKQSREAVRQAGIAHEYTRNTVVSYAQRMGDKNAEIAMRGVLRKYREAKRLLESATGDLEKFTSSGPRPRSKRPR